MELKENKVSAVDLAQVIIINSDTTKKIKKQQGLLSSQDLAFQEARKSRKVKKLDFEIR